MFSTIESCKCCVQHRSTLSCPSMSSFSSAFATLFSYCYCSPCCCIYINPIQPRIRILFAYISRKHSWSERASEKERESKSVFLHFNSHSTLNVSCSHSQLHSHSHPLAIHTVFALS